MLQIVQHNGQPADETWRVRGTDLDQHFVPGIIGVSADRRAYLVYTTDLGELSNPQFDRKQVDQVTYPWGDLTRTLQ
ncbi:MAG TPA: hypothetical protein VFT87_03760 [Candidatus Saccharimonadales bacterium]|nr:hypothetical protein [Candidatus Saccharimonadales bacterium]